MPVKTKAGQQGRVRGGRVGAQSGSGGSPASPPSAPGQPAGLTAGTATGSTMPLTWTAPASGGTVTDYVVQYALAGSGSWSTFSHSASTTTAQTVTGLTASTSYDFRVAATGPGGQGTFSSTITASTASGSISWVTAFSDTMDSDEGGWAGYTLRNVIQSSRLSGAGSNVRVTFVPPAAGTVTLSDVFIGELSGTYGFDGGQKRLTFSASNSVVLTSGGGNVVSDPVAFTYSSASAIVVAMAVSAGGAFRRDTTGLGQQAYYLLGNDASTQAPTGYTIYNPYCYGCSTIEVG